MNYYTNIYEKVYFMKNFFTITACVVVLATVVGCGNKKTVIIEKPADQQETTITIK